ncbi:MAG: hypothetical protein RLZZ210_1288 [Pseudomonadota bacterium]|jgi:hypothetical protein
MLSLTQKRYIFMHTQIFLKINKAIIIYKSNYDLLPCIESLAFLPNPELMYLVE